MSIIFIDNRKRLKKYLDSTSKQELENTYFVAISDDLDRKDFPKKVLVTFLGILIPPPDIVTNYIISRDKEKFQERYYRYLSRPFSRMAVNKIAKLFIMEQYNVIVCFGDIEYELHIPKYVRKVFETVFPDIEVFDYKDWKKDPDKVIKYSPDDIDDIIDHIMDDASSIGKLIEDVKSCQDEYDHFYND